jgi:phosphatidylserine/phosphatidylglycerophosphate/cardiolipin synthase-like enzyme
MIQELINAKKRNPKLDIKVMMPGKGERGIPGFLYSNLNMESARQLLEAGIDVRFLSTFKVDGEQVESFSHLKAMAVDGKVLSIGSANGDARTLSQNHELNNLIYDQAATKKFIDEQLEPDWKSAKPVTLAQIEALPFWKKWIFKVLESVDFLF